MWKAYIGVRNSEVYPWRAGVWDTSKENSQFAETIHAHFFWANRKYKKYKRIAKKLNAM